MRNLLILISTIIISFPCLGQGGDLDECDTLFITWEKVAQPKGGLDALTYWIEENNSLKNIETRKRNEYRVILQFNVDTTGFLIDVEVIKGIGEPYDNEAIRLLSDCPIIWEPSICRGSKRITPFSYPISFKKVKKKKGIGNGL